MEPLGRHRCAARQLQGFIIAMLLFVEVPQVAQGIGGSEWIIETLGNVCCGAKSLCCTKEQCIVLQVPAGAKIVVGEPGFIECIRLGMGVGQHRQDGISRVEKRFDLCRFTDL